MPCGTLRAYAFFNQKMSVDSQSVSVLGANIDMCVRISLDVNPTDTQVLVGGEKGPASLVAIRKAEHKGHVEMTFNCKDRDQSSGIDFGATYATMGQAVIFAQIESVVLVWDAKKGNIVYGLEHDEGECDGCLLVLGQS